MATKGNIGKLDRLVLYPAAWVVEKIHFAYLGIKILIDDTRKKPGVLAPAVRVFAAFLFIGQLASDSIQALENKLYFKIKSLLI